MKHFSLGTTELYISDDSFKTSNTECKMKIFRKDNNEVEYNLYVKYLKNGNVIIPFTKNLEEYNSTVINAYNFAFPFQLYENVKIKNESSKYLIFEFKSFGYTPKEFINGKIKIELYQNETFTCNNGAIAYIVDEYGNKTDFKGNDLLSLPKNPDCEKAKSNLEKFLDGNATFAQIGQCFKFAQTSGLIREIIDSIFAQGKVNILDYHSFAEKIFSSKKVLEKDSRKYINGGIISNFVYYLFFNLRANQTTLEYLLNKFENAIDNKQHKYAFLYCTSVLPILIEALKEHRCFVADNRENNLKLLYYFVNVNKKAFELVENSPKNEFIYELPENFEKRMIIKNLNFFLSNKYGIFFDDVNFEEALNDFVKEMDIFQTFTEAELNNFYASYVRFNLKSDVCLKKFFEYYFSNERIEKTKEEFQTYIELDSISETIPLEIIHISKMMLRFYLDFFNSEYKDSSLAHFLTLEDNAKIKNNLVEWALEEKDNDKIPYDTMSKLSCFFCTVLSEEECLDLLVNNTFENFLLKIEVLNKLTLYKTNTFRNECFYKILPSIKDECQKKIILQKILRNFSNYFYLKDVPLEKYREMFENKNIYDYILNTLNNVDDYDDFSQSDSNIVKLSAINYLEYSGGVSQEKKDELNNALKNRIITTLKYKKYNMNSLEGNIYCLNKIFMYNSDDENIAFLNEIENILLARSSKPKYVVRFLNEIVHKKNYFINKSK